MPKPNKRTDLVQHGMDMVHQNGFSSTGVAMISKAAGAPKGSFYNHFETKDAFGQEILKVYFDEVMAAVEEELDPDRQPVPTRLRAYFERLKAFNKSHGYARGCLIGNFSGEAPSLAADTVELVRQLYLEWARALAVCLEEGQSKGEVRDDISANSLAVMMLDAWQGAVLHSKVERTGTSLDGFIDTLLPAILLKGQVS